MEIKKPCVIKFNNKEEFRKLLPHFQPLTDVNWKTGSPLNYRDSRFPVYIEFKEEMRSNFSNSRNEDYDSAVLIRELEFPKKWSILSTSENLDELKEFLERVKREELFDTNGWCGNSSGVWYSFDGHRLDARTRTDADAPFTVVTIEQLKQHYLKENEMNTYNLKVGDLLTEKGRINKITVDDVQEKGCRLSGNPGYDTWDYINEQIASGRWTLMGTKKKIIGYKAPVDLFKGRIPKGSIFSEKSKYGFIMYNKHHMSSGVPTELVESWEAVYQEEFKVDDWVTCINTGNKGAGWRDGLTFKVTKVEKASQGIVYFGGYEECGVYGESLRTASKSEIEKAKTISIAGYKASFKEDKVTFGCSTFSKSTVEELINIMNKANVEFKVGTNEIKMDTLQKILKQFNQK